jgi:hypothetical protein
MTTPRQKFIGKALVNKYGLIGKVATRYLYAGLHVEINHPTRLGPVPIIAKGNKQTFAIEVLKPNQNIDQAIESIARKAQLLKARPVLAVPKTLVNREKLRTLLEKAKANNTKIKLV